VFFVYCLIVFTAVIFAVSNSSIVLMSRYCCKLVVIKEQFCNCTCTYYTYRSNKSPFKKNGRGSPVPAPLFDLFLFAIECNSISFFFYTSFLTFTPHTSAWHLQKQRSRRTFVADLWVRTLDPVVH